MGRLLDHIDNLLSSPETVVKDTTDDWTTLQIQHQNGCSAEVGEESCNPWEASVINLYHVDGPTSSSEPPGIEGYFPPSLQKDVDVQSILAILSSDRTNDEISDDLIELLGLDQIEVASKILGNRTSATKQLNQYLDHLKTATSVQTGSELGSHEFSPKIVRQRMQNQLDTNAARPLYSAVAQAEMEVLPHVYSSSKMSQGNVVSQFGSKYMLPIGTSKETYEAYEEVIIPPANPVPPMLSERLMNVSELSNIIQGSFTGYSALNRIQSIVYPTAFGTNENLLICAPTGAGKTDVAMLTILRVIDQHRRPNTSSLDVHAHLTIDRDAFKIIYVAPMKALASEIVRKFAKRLAWLSIEVRELTGDMQLTKAEIAQTQVIVTTPEKWDVVTRKPSGEGEIASSLKLLIIDEVHLLNEERGAVIEAIVARTLRQVESSQSMIRIVGLSATLPNYKDVAEFLCASPQKGLFYFDSSFRPVPLEQHFLGIKGKPGSLQSRKNLDNVTFQKVSELVAQGHQVMVFVHARKETVKAAVSLREMALLEGKSEDFLCEDHPQWNFYRQKIGESRNKEMKQLFDGGFGIHHAGMLRSDRNMIEKVFHSKAIKVLCCTATLAWGVNLPAHAVIIKGTQVYDSSKGKFVDLSVLDVLQVFGRAGRPGLETSGEGYICTTEDKLTHYLDAVTSQIPIESQFQAGLMDSLNAEIALGTVANTRDAVQWLGYTYLFVRMRMNPHLYGVSRDSIQDDPQLGGKRNELIGFAARSLAQTKMIVYDVQEGSFGITDLGRIAAKYYIRHSSIEIFNKQFRPKMSEADVLVMLSMSTEFDQIQVRDSEGKELKQLMERVPCEVRRQEFSHLEGMTPKDVLFTTMEKVNILLQGFICREVLDDFALVSDMAYVAQNGGRIVRALLEIAISQKWANSTAVLMGMSKAIESRMWSFDHPLRQFNLKSETMFSLEKWADDWTISQLATADAAALGTLVRLNEAHGRAIVNASKQFPCVQIGYTLQPIAGDILKISLKFTRVFDWNTKIHGTSEPFWFWIEDREASTILQLSHIVFREATDSLSAEFFIPIPNGQPPVSVTIRSISDRWVGAEDSMTIPLDTLIMPSISSPHTPVLNLPFLGLEEIVPPVLKNIFTHRIHNLNALQTQTFWNLIHTRGNSLLCAPAGSGKSALVQMAIWATILNGEGWILVLTPTKVAAHEMVSELRIGSQVTGIVLEFRGDHKSIFSCPNTPTIRVVSADQLLEAFSGQIPRSRIPNLRLVVCEGLEQLTPTYELALSLLRLTEQSSPTRFIGISASLNDAADLAKWLGVGEASTHSFRPQDRDQSLVTSKQTFSIPYSVSLLKAMVKPAHRAIQDSPPGSPVLLFVPSREQSRPIALDLITRCTLETEVGRGYIPHDVSDELLETYCTRLQDATLLDFVKQGIGFFHLGIRKPDRLLMLEMLAEGIIRVLIVPKDACWSVPTRAPVVIVMGTQYVHVGTQGTLREIRDYTLTEVVRMQSRAIQQSGIGFFHLFCQVESLETYTRFLDEGLPLESQLPESQAFREWVRSFYTANRANQYIVDVLSFTYLAQRVVSNPSYYGFTTRERDQNLSAVVDQVVDRTMAITQ